MEDIRLSVITPARNPDWRLVEACESIARVVALLEARQVPIWIEHVICDDASTGHDAGELYANLQRRFAFVHLVENTTGTRGPAAARNAALRHARGNWVGFLDADDHIVPEGLVRLLDVARGTPHSRWVIGDSVAYYPDGTEIAKPSYCCRFCHDGDASPVFVDAGTLMRLIAGPPNLFLGTMITEKALLERAGAFDPGLRRSEDWYLTLSMATQSGVIYVPTTVLRFSRGSGSLTESDTSGEMDSVRATWRALTEPRFRSARRVLRWTLITQLVQLRDLHSRRQRRARAFRFGLMSAILAPEEPKYLLAALRCIFARPRDAE